MSFEKSPFNAVGYMERITKRENVSFKFCFQNVLKVIINWYPRKTRTNVKKVSLEAFNMFGTYCSIVSKIGWVNDFFSFFFFFYCFYTVNNI